MRCQRLAPWMDDGCRVLCRRSRQLERRYRKSKKPCDRLTWIQAERNRHRVYRLKECSFWNFRLAEQSGRSRKLWQFIFALMGSGRTKAPNKGCSTAQELMDFFNEKIASVRRSTGDCPIQSSRETATVTFEEFQECTEENVGFMSSQSKSCALDPLSTNILKEFHPEILPFMTDMCNTPLRQGKLPLSQRHAIVTPRLKKANADRTDSRNLRPFSNQTFTSKFV